MIAAVLILVLGSLLWITVAFAVRRDGAYRRAVAEARRAQRLATRINQHNDELLGTLIATQNRVADTYYAERRLRPVPPWPRSET